MPTPQVLDLDATFTALADPTRRAIVARLATGDATVNELAAPFAITLPGISKHLKVLEGCGLISRTRQAQFRPCHLEVEALDAAMSWIDENRRIWTERFDQLDSHLREHPTKAAPPTETETSMTEPAIQADELTYTRIFDAPRALVFRCMIEPEHLTKFWGPTGMSTPLEEITVDARPGGVFEAVMVSDADGSRYPMRAVYVEVTEPERLVWTNPESGMTTTSTFVDLDGSRTEVRIHQTKVPEPFRGGDAQAGFKSSLDRFAAHLAQLSG